MPLNDLRAYIAQLEQAGEIQRIEQEVQPVLEVGAIIRRSYELRAPAPLFLNLRGYPGHRILGAPIGLSHDKNRSFARFAISMDMASDSSPMEIINEYIRRLAKPIKPVMVERGPCKENIVLGEDIDLQGFPVPVLNRPMEFAIALGTEPVTPWVAGTGLPPNISEMDIIGAIRGAPLELVKCETVDLEVPATSEIVIEGFVPPHERKEEGPFGERTGFLVSDRAPRPVYHVTAITHRNNPILPVTCAGATVDDFTVALSLTKAANILNESRRQGFSVRRVYCPPEALSYWTVVSTKVPNSGYVRRLAQAIRETAWGRSSRYLVIVDENIDPTDMGQVLWAISTMCHPKRWLIRAENIPGHPLLPSIGPEGNSNHIGPYTLFDCTWPREWPKAVISAKASFDDIWPKEVQEKVLRDWRAYGYKEEGPE
jgi:3-polyprenyl-4-hydroxybenzoate decarboxylase